MGVRSIAQRTRLLRGRAILGFYDHQEFGAIGLATRTHEWSAAAPAAPGQATAATSFQPTTEQLTLLADLDHWRKDTIEPDPEDPFRNRATAEYTHNFPLETNHLREALLAHLA